MWREKRQMLRVIRNWWRENAVANRGKFISIHYQEIPSYTFPHYSFSILLARFRGGSSRGEGYCHLIYNKNLSPTRSKAVDIVGGCEFTSHKAREMLSQQSLLNSERRGVIGARNVRSAFVDELTVDCMAQPQCRICERELLSYSNRGVQLC